MLVDKSPDDKHRVGVGGIHFLPHGHPGFGHCCAKLAQCNIQFACVMTRENAVRIYAEMNWTDEFPNEIRLDQNISMHEPHKHLTAAMLHLLKGRLNGTETLPGFPKKQ